MSHGNIIMQAIDSTGEVVGLKAAQPAGVWFHGFFFSNSSTIGSVSFYVPVHVVDQTYPALPSAAGTLLFTIQAPANASKEFFSEAGIWFPYGLFAVTSAATITGAVAYS